ncbi:di-heme-cytochrome C peroxidase [Azospirillum doebereinerae]
MKATIFATAAAASLLLSACAEPPAPPRPVPVKPPTQIDGLWYLDQNWSQEARQWYYNTSQGAQIIRYDWFMALEDPQTKAPFAKSLPRYGYPAGTAGSWNPDLLPLGFVKDVDPKSKAEWFGMTCAACHTGDVTVNGQTMRIDGAVTTGDLYGFIAGLSAAVRTTVTVDGVFEPFAGRVLGPDATPAQRLALYNDLKAFDTSFATFVAQSTPATPWGPMRTDAFGMIFNRVSVIDLHIPKNNRAPDAPVSYPVLWDAPHQPFVQWNGLLPSDNSLEALGRNAGEVLGVFGTVALRKPDIAHYYYESSVRGRNLVAMENQLRKLRSPVWPDSIAGTVDTIKAAAGADLYQQNCASCHQLLPRGETYTTVPIHMEPLFNWAKPDDPKAVVAAFGTICTKGIDAAVAAKMVTVNYAADPKMAVDALCRNSDTGVLAGVAMPPKLLGGAPLSNPDLSANLLANAVLGAVLGELLTDPGLVDELLAGDKAPAPWTTPSSSPSSAPDARAASWSGTRGEALDSTPLVTPNAPMTDQHRKIVSLLQNSSKVKPTLPASSPTKASAAKAEDPAAATKELADKIKRLLAYKARPLDGVWASAPYMHNGSVPNLYEMLLPVSQRSVAFKMGGGALDPVKVGVDSAAATSTFLFDTAKPGNRNTGHEFGAGLTDTQRWELLEYLKTL